MGSLPSDSGHAGSRVYRDRHLGWTASTEYAVMHAVANEPNGPHHTNSAKTCSSLKPACRACLSLRLEKRGLVERVSDAVDGRAQRIRLAPPGLGLQRRVGLRVTQRITAAMTRAFDDAQLTMLRDLSLTCRSDPALLPAHDYPWMPVRISCH